VIERHEQNGTEDPSGGGFAGFLRSLFEGVPWRERAEKEETRSLAAPSSGVLRVHNANGRTCVRGEDRTDVGVRALKVVRAESANAAAELLEASQLIADRTADAVLELEVDVPSKWNRRGHMDLELRVPRNTSVEIVAANGRVAVAGLRGAVKARSSNGSVELSDVIGDVNVATSNAKVCCCDTRGDLVARSSNGKIELDDHCGSIDASTSNGLIRASVEEIGSDGVRLATSNGRIVLEVPGEIDAEVDIRVDNGVIRNDHPLCKASRNRNGQLRGRLGSGGAPIRLRTSNGSISLR